MTIDKSILEQYAATWKDYVEEFSALNSFEDHYEENFDRDFSAYELLTYDDHYSSQLQAVENQIIQLLSEQFKIYTRNPQPITPDLIDEFKHNMKELLLNNIFCGTLPSWCPTNLYKIVVVDNSDIEILINHDAKVETN